ncbi:MAG TPA: tetratricopeptide repeat protein [Thermoanaerobaculia bacterium]|jgi:tetratricopeptide (TPR) repeat protein|nr:tetratricopeptide repeat protein [Thermoanaerobaculia bacterium]
MTEIHPTPEALEQFLLGQLATPEMREIARHLLTGCQRCHEVTATLWEPTDREEELSLAEDVEAVREEPRDRYDEVLDRVFQKVLAAETVVAEQRAAGRKLFAELMQISAERRHLLLSNSQRFKSWMLCECLIEESLAAGFEEPRRAVEIAKLATLAADRLQPEDGPSVEALTGLRARAWAHLGNAYRILFDLASSEQAHAVAEALVEEGPVALLDRARVLVLLASLRLDQRRFPEALQLFDRGAYIYKKLGQWHLLGRTLIQKSLVCNETGDSDSEMTLLRRALDLIDPQAEPRVFLSARHQLIKALHEGGRSREAFALLFHTRPLYLKIGDRSSLLRLRWMEGQVAFGLQRSEQAEVAFREVREGFGELGLEYEAALASLDLAGVYIVQGRTADVRLVAEETLAIFQKHNRQQEAITALLVFRDAARLDQAGLALVREVSDFLKRARNNPELHFPPSS